MKTPQKAMMHLALAITLMTSGCDENRRIADLAQQELERRAVETQQLAELHSKVQQEHFELGQGRDRLEEDRRQLATQRHRDPLIATAITSAVWLLVCALPLFICWRLLQTSAEHEIDQTVQEVLLKDLVAEEPLLLPKTGSPRPLEFNRETNDSS